MNLLKSFKNNRLIIGASLMLMSAPLYAYDGSSGDTTAEGAFNSMVNWIIDILSGSGGLLLTLVALVAAAIGMASGSVKFMWSMVGVALLCSIGPSVIKALMGVTF